MRVFVGIEIPEESRKLIASHVARIRGALPDAKWVGTESYHITLSFVGEILESDVPRYDAKLSESVLGQRAIPIHFLSPWSLPKRTQTGSSRLDWHRLTSRAIVDLQSRVASSLEAAGLVEPERRPYHPHVTVARCRKPWNQEAGQVLVPILPAPVETSRSTWGSIVLYRSRLSSSGAQYDSIGTLSLRRNRMSWWPLVIGSYLLGSIPFGYLIGRARSGIDVRRLGSGNVGATNVIRTVGPASGLLVLVLDMAKGAIPVSVAVQLGAPDRVIAGVALATVFGHVFSVFLKFRGGKGVATAIGAFLAVGTRGRSLGYRRICHVGGLETLCFSSASVVSVAMFPLVLVLFNRIETFGSVSTPVVVSALIASFTIVARHLGNIRRLLAGRESRLEDPVEVRAK